MKINCFRLFFVAAIVLAGCGAPERLATSQQEAVAKTYLEQLKRGQFQQIEDHADPSIKSDALPKQLEQMAALLPAGDPLTVTLVGDSHVSTTSFETVNLTYEFHYPGKWLLENVAIKTKGGESTLIGLNVMPIARSLEEQHRFDLAGKSSLHYLWLALAVFMPSFTVFALIVCARTRLKGRKWPWIVFILFGVGAFSINWATGQLDFSPLRITLLSAGVFAAPLGPWVVSFSLPVGAFVFLARRKGLAAAAVNSPG